MSTQTSRYSSSSHQYRCLPASLYRRTHTLPLNNQPDLHPSRDTSGDRHLQHKTAARLPRSRLWTGWLRRRYPQYIHFSEDARNALEYIRTVGSQAPRIYSLIIGEDELRNFTASIRTIAAPFSTQPFVEKSCRGDRRACRGVRQCIFPLTSSWKQISSLHPPTNKGKWVIFSLDIGLIGLIVPLYFVVGKSRDHGIRMKAIKLLRSSKDVNRNICLSALVL
ncbi:uncharacterized protein K444DRAFT_690313 [Hyaloscypha bicolor E]|uniref:Uncharacterized protein n=1 Tax=Hyaloscypha bicolor E TaxID=1095630 RepID=A0A2J6TX29_9HELO|nr:uncharacterized protein K444DRAFT_690313 [Hyaloscypha bicolor E]PMD67531.1 hypothetical protein K444DRAFT_690313 [Hyaloscypha bicolor E]